MLFQYLFEGLGGDFAVVEVEAVEELAGTHAIFGQPATQGGHVVGARGVDAVFGQVFGLDKLMAKHLGHTLHLKAHDAQLLHYFRHTGGNHAEVFAAGNHWCRIDESGQFFQGFLLPIVIMAVEIKVLVNGIDSLFLLLAEALVGFGFVQFNARDIFVFLVWCRDEKGVNTFFRMLAFNEMEALVFDLFNAQR